VIRFCHATDLDDLDDLESIVSTRKIPFVVQPGV
jgi:hypothetical protein